MEIKKKLKNMLSLLREKSILKEVGKFFIDLAKLTFGGAVLSAALGTNYDKTLVIVLGSLSVISLFLLGIFLISLSLEK